MTDLKVIKSVIRANSTIVPSSPPVFERYNIVSEGDLAEAALKLDAAAKNLTGTIPGTVGTVSADSTSARQRK